MTDGRTVWQSTLDGDGVEVVERLLTLPLSSLALRVLEVEKYTELLGFLPWASKKQVGGWELAGHACLLACRPAHWLKPHAAWHLLPPPSSLLSCGAGGGDAGAVDPEHPVDADGARGHRQALPQHTARE